MLFLFPSVLAEGRKRFTEVLLNITQVLSQVVTGVLVTQLLPTVCDPMVCPWNSPGKNTGVGGYSIRIFLLQGTSTEIFLTQGSNPGLLHCRQMFYHLIHQSSTPQLD